jgi:hypothetical protein
MPHWCLSVVFLRWLFVAFLIRALTMNLRRSAFKVKLWIRQFTQRGTPTSNGLLSLKINAAATETVAAADACAVVDRYSAACK